ncbi:MAG: hypothetical protein HY898_07635 [Deltaproteobacteria bacterium]|nr:hypothetical protein [Deltaproteobacteria bacterium]
MMDWQNIVVLAGALVFMAFLLWRMRPVRKGVGAVGSLAQSAMQARAKAREATSPRERAMVLHQAAGHLSTQRGGGFAAMSLYFRALHADPTWPDPIEGLRRLLWFRRPRSLERILWKRLSVAPWQGEQRPVAAAAAKALAELYRSRLHNRSRALVMGRIAAELMAGPAAGSHDDQAPEEGG